MHAGGTLYLFDKKQERYFRRDGHHWRKKANGKTVRETHEKLKVLSGYTAAYDWSFWLISSSHAGPFSLG